MDEQNNNFANQPNVNDQLYVVVRNTDNILYQGHAYGVSSINDFGKFSILPYHSNFISIIKEKLIIHKNKKENIEINVDKGILQNRENKVEIYLGIETI